MTLLRRMILAVFLIVGLYTGGWAYFAPRSWYDGFPGFGRTWVSLMGPFNEHLATDTGAMFLALVLLAAIALIFARSDSVVRTAGVAWLVFNALHFAYHLQHLHVFTVTDKMLNLVGMTGVIAFSAVLLLPTPAPAKK